jgi:hypothetical protein
MPQDAVSRHANITGSTFCHSTEYQQLHHQHHHTNDEVMMIESSFSDFLAKAIADKQREARSWNRRIPLGR